MALPNGRFGRHDGYPARCAAEVRSIALVTEVPLLRQILRTWANPRRTRAWRRLAAHRCGWEMPDAGKDRFDPQAQPAPDCEFDQPW